MRFKFKRNIILSIFFLFIGGSIYIIFRPATLIMFSWFEAFNIYSFVNTYRELGEHISLPDFIIFNLPDGLWITSYLFIVNSVIPVRNKRELLFWILLLPLISVLGEFLQYYHIIEGQFDIIDILCYILPVIINLIILRYEKVF